MRQEQEEAVTIPVEIRDSQVLRVIENKLQAYLKGVLTIQKWDISACQSKKSY